MASDSSSKPSFSRGRKWSVGLNVALTVVLVMASLIMLNYLSGRYFSRFYLGTNTRIQLSPRTVGFLNSMTNQVRVTLYYDKDDALYSDISELLKEYRATGSKITIATVDYYRDPGAAQELKTKYNLGSSTNKNLVIFDCEGRTKIVNGDALVQKELEQISGKDSPQPEFRKKPVSFSGEMMFTSALLAVSNPKPLQAYFLQGHGEHQLDDAGELGYQAFAAVLRHNYVQLDPLDLLGTNTVPADCNLLVIAGPKDPVSPSELERIAQYLNEGGRLLLLFNVASVNQETGLEKVLEKWGVQVGNDIVKDPDYTTVGTDVIVGHFSRHPAVNPLTGSRIQLILPRPVSKLDVPAPATDGLKVEEIAFAGPHSYLQSTNSPPQVRSWPVMAAVEKIRGAVTERGATRILVVGDSLFLGNRQIESGVNRDFADYAVNWLLERTVLLQGLGPRAVTEYRLLVPKARMQSLQWILLGAIPGGILIFGGLVWLRRRK